MRLKTYCVKIFRLQFPDFADARRFRYCEIRLASVLRQRIKLFNIYGICFIIFTTLARNLKISETGRFRCYEIHLASDYENLYAVGLNMSPQ